MKKTYAATKLQMSWKIKYGKIAVVIIITVLIWVWADLALDETLPISGAIINTVKSVDQRLLISLSGRPTVAIDKLTLKGPASRVAELRRKLKEGAISPYFFFDPTQHQSMTSEGSYTFSVAEFIKNIEKIKQFGLTVETCSPQMLTVEITELVKKPLKIMCMREQDGVIIEGATTYPEKTEMFVFKEWTAEKLIAKVELSQGEINQARKIAITKTPYIELTPNRKRYALQSVQVMTPPQQDRRKPGIVKNVTLGISLSTNLQGKYQVQITNPDVVMGAIAINATPEAKNVYENMRYQVILEIDDSDKDMTSQSPLKKELAYNFPDEYVRKNEIELNQQPVIARYNLVPLETKQTESGPPM